MVDLTRFDSALAHSENIKSAFDKYNSLGYKCLPIEAASKVIRIKGWQDRSFTKDDFKGLSNIGVQLGATSGNLIDIDLDNPIARKIAPLFLPPTSWRFGRVYPEEGDSIIASHWLYHVEGDTKSSADWRLSKKETGGAVVKVLEYRGDNSQTVFPPSVHKSKVQWLECSSTPALVTSNDLKQALGVIMTVIWAKHCIAPGVFHDAMLRVIGGFAKAGIDSEVTKKAVQCICYLSDQENSDDRLREVEDTYKKLRDGKTVAGFASLEAFGWETDRIKKWLPSRISESGKVAKDGKPKINMSKVSMEDAVNEAITILSAVPNEHKRLFSYGGKAVAVVKRTSNRYDDIQVIPPNSDAFAHHIETHIQFVKSDPKEHVDVLVEADGRLVRRMMDPSINWGMPQLDGVVQYPILLPSGKLLTDEGFCSDSGLFIGDNLKLTIDEIKSTSIQEAKTIIEDVYDDFPYHNQEVGISLSVTCLLTAVARKAIRLSPAFIATSPYPQDGKTVWSFVPQIVLSKSYSNYAFGASEEEQGKQLMTYFMAEPSALVFDNQNGKLHSQPLTELLTSGTFVGRMLGTNEQVTFRPKVLIIANGINVRPSPEISTRSILVDFDRRKHMNFKHPNFLDYVLSKRRDLVKASLRLLLNGLTDGAAVQFASGPSRFQEWDEFVRRAVIAAGYVDPMRKDLLERVVDDLEESKEQLLDWLFTNFPPGEVFKTADIVDRIGFNHGLEELFKVIARRAVFSPVVVGNAIANLRGSEVRAHRLSWRRSTANMSVGQFKLIKEASMDEAWRQMRENGEVGGG